MHTDSEAKLKRYVYSLIEAHAYTQRQQADVEFLRHRARQAEQDASMLQERKGRLEQISATLRRECSGLDDNAQLHSHLARRAAFLPGTQERFPRTGSALPKITVAEMGWALEYLDEIREDSLRELEELQATHRKGREGLEQMLRKYEEKLEKKEENLEKALSEMKNTRRYM